MVIYPPPDEVVVARWKISFGEWWDFIYYFPSLWLGSRVHFVWYDSKDGVWYDADDKTSMEEPKDWRHLPQNLRAWHLPLRGEMN